MTPQRKRLLHSAMGAALLLTLLIWVQHSIGWRTLFAPWQRLSLPALLTAILLMGVSYAARAWRITDYFQLAFRPHFLPALRLTLWHNFLNNMLPFRSGELAFPVLMQRYFGIAPTAALPGLLLMRVLDLACIGALGSLALAGWLWPPAVAYSAAAGCILLPWAIFLAQRPLQHALAGRSGRLASLLHTFLTGLPNTAGRLAKAMAMTLFNWALKLILFAWLMTTLLPNLSFSLALLASLGGEMTSVLPFHGIAGAGSYEAGVSAPLLLAHISTGLTTQAAIALHLFILGTTIIALPFAWILPGKRAE